MPVKKKLTKSQKRSAKAHIISVYGSPKVLKKKESLKTRAKISATMRKRCESRKWGSKKIWSSCNNDIVKKNKKSNNKIKCPNTHFIRRKYITKKGTVVKSTCVRKRTKIKTKKPLNNKKYRSAKAHVISVYGSPKVVNKRKINVRTKISETRKLKGLNKKNWGNDGIWK